MNHLHEYDFDGATVAAVALVPVPPAVYSDLAYEGHIDTQNPAASFFRVGTALYKEAALQRAEARLDSAFRRVDVTSIIAGRALRQGSQHLGYRVVDRPRDADFLLDLQVKEFSLHAATIQAQVEYYLEADLTLVDRGTRRRIWHTRAKMNEPLSDVAPYLGMAVGNMISGRALSRLSVDELAAALRRLCMHTADAFALKLRDDFYASRDR